MHGFGVSSFIALGITTTPVLANISLFVCTLHFSVLYHVLILLFDLSGLYLSSILVKIGWYVSILRLVLHVLPFSLFNILTI